MKRIIIALVSLVIVAASMSACRKDNTVSLNVSDRYRYIYTENYWSLLFQDYWDAMNQSYVFWLEESLDWDEVYTEYKPKFEAIDKWLLDDETSYFENTESCYNDYGTLLCKGDSAAWYNFHQIVGQLVDRHYVLSLYDLNKTVYDNSELQERDYYHAYDSYFDIGLKTTIAAGVADQSISDYCSGSYLNGYSSTPLEMCSYRLNDDIAYLRLSSFVIYDSNNDPINPRENTITEVLDNFESIARNTPDFKGAILDLRHNTGGYNNDLDSMLARFINVNDKVLVSTSCHKSGPNRLDYTSLVPNYMNGLSEQESYTFPIAVLVDLYSISMSEITCFAAKEFSEQSAVVGERTFGATCSLLNDYFLTSGVVSTYNFQIYSATSIHYYGKDLKFYEGIGVPPDVEVFYDTDWGTTTVDLQKQAAQQYLNSL